MANCSSAETSVLFELIAARYERRSILMTANQPFGEWGTIFSSKMMTIAAADMLAHRAVILEMNVENYHRRDTLKQMSGHGARQAAKPDMPVHTSGGDTDTTEN